jgi:hypothetical protein
MGDEKWDELGIEERQIKSPKDATCRLEQDSVR